jgi:hypothetical protein
MIQRHGSSAHGDAVLTMNKFPNAAPHTKMLVMLSPARGRMLEQDNARHFDHQDATINLPGLGSGACSTLLLLALG